MYRYYTYVWYSFRRGYSFCFLTEDGKWFLKSGLGLNGKNQQHKAITIAIIALNESAYQRPYYSYIRVWNLSPLLQINLFLPIGKKDFEKI